MTSRRTSEDFTGAYSRIFRKIDLAKMLAAALENPVFVAYRELRKLRGRGLLGPDEELPLPDWNLDAPAQAEATRLWFAVLRAGADPRDPQGP